MPKAVSSASSFDRRQALITLGALGASACGYSLAGRGSFLPDYIRTIGIPLFVNKTPFLTAEQLFTEKVRIEFQSRGRYAVQPTEVGADGVVRGEIVAISATPAGFTDVQLATRYRFTVVVAVKFDDLAQKRTLWENAALSFSDEYELQSRLSFGGGADASAFLEQERAAMDRLSTDFARSVVSSILEAF
ncbi:MAG TPA: LptE family protein [Vicinamibacterales bacterium]|nr:LptE family protein [Vicinamibacterales bacterium]